MMTRISLAISARASSRRRQSSILTATSASVSTAKNAGHRQSLPRVDVERLGDRGKPPAGVVQSLGLLRAAARVLARPRDAPLDGVSLLPDASLRVSKIKRHSGRRDFVGEETLVALHLGDAVGEVRALFQGRAQFVQRLQRLSHRAERGLAFDFAKPCPGAGLAPRPAPVRVGFGRALELALGASGVRAPLLRLLAQSRELRLFGDRRFSGLDEDLARTSRIVRDARRPQRLAQRPTRTGGLVLDSTAGVLGLV